LRERERERERKREATHEKATDWVEERKRLSKCFPKKTDYSS
jgi:hypothetical protein